MKPMKPRIARPAMRIHRRRMRRKQYRSRVENFFFGVALAAFGVVAWGWQQHADWAEPLFDWWPMVLVWIGLGKLLSRHLVGAVGLIFGGALAQLHILRIADLEYTWPLILVAVGLAVTAGAVLGRDDTGSEGGDGMDGADEDSDVSMAEELEGEVEVSEEIRHG